MRTVAAHASHSKKKMGKVKGMHISLASNGAKSVLQHEPPEGSMFGGSVDGDETIHPSMGHLQKHIKASLGPHMAANTGSGGATQPGSTPGGMPDNSDMNDGDTEAA